MNKEINLKDKEEVKTYMRKYYLINKEQINKIKGRV
jgi:hypothetical protein